MAESKHYFYVVECRDGSYYAGYTNNLDKRIKMHNEGKGAKYTRGRNPVHIIYSETYETKGEALSAEYQFKRLSRKEKDRLISMEGSTHDVATKKLSTK